MTKTRAFEYATRPSPFPDKPALPQKLFYGKRTQFKRPKSPTNNCYRKVYNDHLPKVNEPNRTQLKPIFARNFFRESHGLQKNLYMQSKPNFKNSRQTLTRETKGTYINLRRNDHKKANPIQTQSKPNPKPIQTQFLPLISWRIF